MNDGISSKLCILGFIGIMMGNWLNDGVSIKGAINLMIGLLLGVGVFLLVIIFLARSIYALLLWSALFVAIALYSSTKMLFMATIICAGIALFMFLFIVYKNIYNYLYGGYYDQILAKPKFLYAIIRNDILKSYLKNFEKFVSNELVEIDVMSYARQNNLK